MHENNFESHLISNNMGDQISRRLKFLGMLLFLFGLITGYLIIVVENRRMGLAAHLQGVMNGTFLVVSGLIWNDLKISESLKKVVFWTLIYGTLMNWVSTLLGAFFGTSKITPIAGEGYEGTVTQEIIVSVGLVSTGLAMLFSLIVIVYGLRGKQI